MEELIYRPIGIIRSPHKVAEGSPVQPSGARGVQGQIELNPNLAPGLKDLDGFSHLIVIYHCHLAKDMKLTVTPFLDNNPHGVFATRAPSRPNPIGLSVVRLDRIEDTTLHLKDVDLVDGTPVLDIKPYVPQFDTPEGCKAGWLDENAGKAEEMKADGRFGE